MDFFPEPPDPPNEDELVDPPQPAWMNPPEDVLPGVVPVELILGRSENTVVMLTGIRAFPTGLQMNLAVRVRGAVGRRDVHHEVFNGPHDDERSATWQAQRLKWGFELSDGTRVTNVDPWPQQPNEGHERPHHPEDRLWTPDRPVLTGGGGGGRTRSVDRDYWLWPLPPTGHLRVVCQWPERNIDLNVQDLDSQPFLDAARRACPAWT